MLLQLADIDDEGSVERRRVPLEEVEGTDDAARVLGLLADRRLLTISDGSVEIAHEALLREWPLLRGWIEDDLEGLRVHRSLRTSAREWREVDRDDGALYRGARLDEARDWAEPRRRKPDRPGARVPHARASTGPARTAAPAAGASRPSSACSPSASSRSPPSR